VTSPTCANVGDVDTARHCWLSPELDSRSEEGSRSPQGSERDA